MSTLHKYLTGWIAIVVIVALAAAGTVLGGMLRKVLWTLALAAVVIAVYFELTKR